MLKHPARKYSAFKPVGLRDRDWPNAVLHPVVDLTVCVLDYLDHLGTSSANLPAIANLKPGGNETQSLLALSQHGNRVSVLLKTAISRLKRAKITIAPQHLSGMAV